MSNSKLKNMFKMFVVCSMMATLFIVSCKTPKHLNSEENNKGAYIHPDLIPPDVSKVTVDDIFKGNELKVTRDGESGKYGLMDKNSMMSGKWIVEPIYDEVRDLHEGIALARLDAKLWFMDMKTGRTIKENIYDDVKVFSGGICIVRLGDKKGWIDKEIKPIGKGIIYDDVEYFRNGVAKVRIGNKWFCINKQFEEVPWQ